MHFRNPKKKKCCFNFKFGNIKLDIICKYKYLGILLDENLNFKSCVETLSEAGGRALSAIIGKLLSWRTQKCSNFGNPGRYVLDNTRIQILFGNVSLLE